MKTLETAGKRFKHRTLKNPRPEDLLPVRATTEILKDAAAMLKEQLEAQEKRWRT